MIYQALAALMAANNVPDRGKFAIAEGTPSGENQRELELQHGNPPSLAAARNASTDRTRSSLCMLVPFLAMATTAHAFTEAPGSPNFSNFPRKQTWVAPKALPELMNDMYQPADLVLSAHRGKHREDLIGRLQEVEGLRADAGWIISSPGASPCFGAFMADSRHNGGSSAPTLPSSPSGWATLATGGTDPMLVDLAPQHGAAIARLLRNLLGLKERSKGSKREMTRTALGGVKVESDEASSLRDKTDPDVALYVAANRGGECGSHLQASDNEAGERPTQNKADEAQRGIAVVPHGPPGGGLVMQSPPNSPVVSFATPLFRQNGGERTGLIPVRAAIPFA
ncbi:hypothetical protein THAOC_22042, partial [Thalassiosira oceanica]